MCCSMRKTLPQGKSDNCISFYVLVQLVNLTLLVTRLAVKKASETKYLKIFLLEMTMI